MCEHSKHHAANLCRLAVREGHQAAEPRATVKPRLRTLRARPQGSPPSILEARPSSPPRPCIPTPLTHIRIAVALLDVGPNPSSTASACIPVTATSTERDGGRARGPLPSYQEPVSRLTVTLPKCSPFISGVSTWAPRGLKKHLARCFTPAAAQTRPTKSVATRRAVTRQTLARLGHKLTPRKRSPEPLMQDGYATHLRFAENRQGSRREHQRPGSPSLFQAAKLGGCELATRMRGWDPPSDGSVAAGAAARTPQAPGTVCRDAALRGVPGAGA